jgi:hypothetical protein
MIENILLVAGCSHAAGYEMDGSEDSVFNRQHSFGNVLGSKLGYRAVNIAFPAACNSTIARGVIEWFTTEYDPTAMKVFVLVGWTDATRMELPSRHKAPYNTTYPFGDWCSHTVEDYQRILLGYHGYTTTEQRFIKNYHNFIMINEQYLQIASVNLMLQLQYFFSMRQVNYLMCNAISSPTRNKCLNFYLDQIDITRYRELTNPKETFYVKYRDAGYSNPLAKYWHHSEIPHALYAEELLKFIERNKCL